MNKLNLISFTSKFLIGGVKSAIITCSDNSFKTRTMTDDKSVLSEIEWKETPPREFIGKEIAIYNVPEFTKFLSLLEDEFDVSLITTGNKAFSIKFSDSVGTKAVYALSESSIIPPVPTLKYIPQVFETVIKITPEFSKRFLRAASAIAEKDGMFCVITSDNKCEILFGQTDTNSNTATILCETSRVSAIPKQYYDISAFCDILLANKDCEDANLSISSEGLSISQFDTDLFSCKYYLIAKAE